MEKKLNILFLCSWYPNPEQPSHGIFYKRQAQALALKHNITVVYAKSLNTVDKEFLTYKEEENFKEICLFYPKIKNTVPLLSSLIKYIKYKTAYKSVLNKIPSHTHFDVIHVNTVFPASIAALVALKKWPSAKQFISEQWSGYYPEDGNYKGFLLKNITERIIKKASAIFVVSNKLKKAMMAHGLTGKYELIKNAVNTMVFKPLSIIYKNENVLNILHVSSLVNREKNIVGIIDIIETLIKDSKKIKLTIIGSNDDEKLNYVTLINQKKLNEVIEFVGYQSPEQIAIYMNKADVFLLFSNFEGMPNVILEALACGLPVISTNVGKVKEMVPEKMGIVLKNNSVLECVETLKNYDRTLFLDKDALHAHILDNYSLLAVCNQISNLYSAYL